MARVIGIDLGTTFSLVAAFQSDSVVVIREPGRGKLLPSVVCFQADGDPMVGETARRAAVVRPERTVFAVKALMGQRYSDIKDYAAGLPYHVVNHEGLAAVEIAGKIFTPEVVSALILGKLKAEAEAYFDEPVSDAVITVPAYFSDAQVTATQNAGVIAGFTGQTTNDQPIILREPMAAALSFGFGLQAEERDKTILVWDLGGGTFDVSIVRLRAGMFTSVATSGDTRLGGKDWDAQLTGIIIKRFMEESGHDIRSDPQALMRVMEAAENAKHTLSTHESASVTIPFITQAENRPLNLSMTISRAEFEESTRALLESMREPHERAMKDAHLEAGDMDEILLVGGASRMPMVPRLLEELTGRQPNQAVNPDEAVVAGAAILAGMQTGDVGELGYHDIIPLTIRVRVEDGKEARAEEVIRRGTQVPVEVKVPLTTTADGQTSAHIVVYQGDSPKPAGNEVIGAFYVNNLPAAPSGRVKIVLTLTVDRNGVMTASALEEKSGASYEVRLTGFSRMRPEEVRRAQAAITAVERSASAAAPDPKEEQARTEAQAAIKDAESLGISEPADHPVLGAIATVQAALENGGSERISASTANLRTLMEEYTAKAV